MHGGDRAEDFGSAFLRSLGFGPSPPVEQLETDDTNPGVANISLERLDALDADVVIIAYPSPDVQSAIESNPLFATVPSSETGGYLPLQISDADAVRTPTPLTIPQRDRAADTRDRSGHLIGVTAPGSRSRTPCLWRSDRAVRVVEWRASGESSGSYSLSTVRNLASPGGPSES